MHKHYPSARAALEGIIRDGQLLAVGGFGLCGIPEALIEALKDSEVEELVETGTLDPDDIHLPGIYVHRIITDLCVLDVTPDGLQLVELAPDVALNDVQARTGTPIRCIE